MSRIALTSDLKNDVTIISNNFIDNYMCNANGEYVKIYLYVLRCFSQPPDNFSLQLIADKMNLMESDVLRAFHYWQQQGFLKMELNEQKQVTSLLLTSPDVHTAATQPDVVTPTPSQPSMTAAGNKANSKPVRKAPPEILQELALITEQYLKCPLTPNDLDKIAYFYENLHFSEELIEYLLEQCVSIGKRSMRYIETVAISWSEQGITTIEQAKAKGPHLRNEYYQILKGFGIRGRDPVELEIDFMKKWLNEYHFSVDLITEACQRTIKSAGNPSFKYADSILTNWKEHGVLTKKDIAALDNLHHAQQQAKQVAATRERSSAKPATATRFSNFDQRGEYDFNQLEKQLNAT